MRGLGAIFAVAFVWLASPAHAQDVTHCDGGSGCFAMRSWWRRRLPRFGG